MREKFEIPEMEMIEINPADTIVASTTPPFCMDGKCPLGDDDE